MTKHHHFSCQSIVKGALEEIIIERNAQFLFSGLISADISQLRESSLEVPTGSSLEQKLVIEPISVLSGIFKGYNEAQAAST